MATNDDSFGLPPLPPGFMPLDDGMPTIGQVPSAPEVPGLARPATPDLVAGTGGNDVSSVLDRIAAAEGVDRSWLDTLAKIESDHNPKAQTGSYKGLFQLSDAEFAKYGGTGDIFDPVANAAAAARKLKAESSDFVRRYGREPTLPELNLLHQQGVGGADAHWRNPDAPAWQNMLNTGEGRARAARDGEVAAERWAKRAIWGNIPTDSRRQFGDVNNVTSGQFVDLWNGKVDRLGGRSAGVRFAAGEGLSGLAGGAGADTLPPLPAGYAPVDEAGLPPLPPGFKAIDDAAKPAAKKAATFADSVGRGVDQMQGMFYGGLEALGEASGSEGLTKIGREGRTRNEEEAKAYGDPAEFMKIRSAGDFGQWAKEMIGSQVPIMAPMLGGAAVGTLVGGPIGGILGAFVPGFIMSTGEVQGNIKDKDPNAVAPGSAFIGGAAVAALDSILPGKVGSALVRRFGAEAAEEIAKRTLLAPVKESALKPVKDSALKAGAKGAVTGMATEGITEALQEAIGDVAAAYGTGKGLDPNLGARMLEAGAGGALLGGLMGPIEGIGERKPQPTGETTPPAAGPAADSQAQPVSDAAASVEPAPTPVAATPPPTAPDLAVLKQLGYDDADIAGMTPEERAAELATAAAQGITAPAVSDAPTAEPIADLTAQIEAMVNGERDGVYLSPDNLANVQSNAAYVEKIAEALNAAQGAQLVENVDGKGGVLVAKDAATAEAVRNEVAKGADPETILGTVTGAGTGKVPGADTVVQQRTPGGAVTRESLVPAAEAPAVAAEMQAPGKSVEAMPTPDAIARREQQIAAEQGAAAPTGDGSRKAPVKVEIPEDVATAGERVAEPTEAQKSAGNYQKAHIKLHGLDITIENPKGSVRRGVDSDGEAWAVTMPAAYGYFKRTTGRDGDQFDVFVGDDPASDRVWVVDQVDPETRLFDEHKSLLGFTSREDALAAYTAAFSDGKGEDRIGAVTEMPVTTFRLWVREGKKTRPLGKIDAEQDDGRVYAGPALTADEIDLIVSNWEFLRKFAKTRKPTSLVQFIVGGGGIEDRGGNVRALAGGLRGRPGLIRRAGETGGMFGPSESSGRSLDDWALRAWEEGYFHGRPDRPAINDLLDLIEEDLRTGDVVPLEDLSYFEDAAIAAEIRRELDDYGVTTRRFRTEASLRKYLGKPREDAAGETQGAQEGQAAPAQPDEQPTQEPTAEVAKAPETGPSQSDGPVPTFADVKALIPEGTSWVTAIRSYLDDKGWSGWAKLSDEQRRRAYNDLKQIAAGNDPARAQDEAEFAQKLARQDAARAAEFKPATEPAVPIAKSVTPDHIINLDDGKKYKSMKRVLASRGETPEQYRQRWGLPDDYPMVAPGYAGAQTRTASSMAKPEASPVAKAEEAAPVRPKTRADFIEALTSGVNDRGAEVIAPNGTTYRIDYLPRRNTYVWRSTYADANGVWVTKGPGPRETWSRPHAASLAADDARLTDKEPEIKEDPRDAILAVWDIEQLRKIANEVGAKWRGQDTRADIIAAIKSRNNTEPNRVRALADAINRAKPLETESSGQTSLVPEATTKEKIAAEAKAKEKKGRASSEEAGPLFNPDAGKQTDLVDLAKTPTKPAKEPDSAKAQPSAAADEKADTEADLDALFDDVLDAQFGKEEKKPALERGGKASSGRKAKAAAKSAAKSAGKGIEEAAKGLMALFDPKGKVGSGPSFDEQTYAKAKPHFQAALAEFAKAGADARTAMTELVKYLAETMGMSRDGIAAMRPYVIRFVKDQTEAPDAGAVSAEPVPAGDQARAPADASAGDGNREPLGAGVAGGGKATPGERRVSGRTEGSGDAGARGADRAGEQPSGPARDRGTVRPESQSADFVIDADEIGKGGLGKKYRDNVAAIRLLKSLEAEGRKATADERRELAKYVGWGALKGAFDPQNKTWAKQHAELKELLTDAEFKAARRSVLNAHYTSPVAVNAMNDALQRLGYTGGRMLEPSVGIGNFFGLMPADMRHNSQLHGVELDSLTSRMAAALYPRAKIAQATAFQDFSIPNGYFDLVQGNPPFGNETISDLDRSPYSGFSIHNYFLAKGIDKLRPGGLMQVIVSHNFLDAQNKRARKWISDRANLIGAVRLPNSAFEENAGTVVVTDILIFQKRADGDAPSHIVADWIDTVDQENTNPKTGETVTHKVNPVFVERPELVLGKPSAAGTMNRANEYTVEPSGDLKTQLDGWVKTLPEGVYQPISRKPETDVDMAVPDGIKVGSYFVNESGDVLQRGPDDFGNKTTRAWFAPSSRAALRMKGMIGLRDALRTQMRLERSPDATAAEIEANRATLNSLYDEFLKKHGHINSQTNRRLFLDDTEAQLVQALEFDYDKGVSKATAEKEGIDPREPSATKADIFKRRVAFPPQDFLTVTTAKDALLASLNYRGKVDPTYMAEVYGKPIDKIVEELGDVIYEDPEAGLVTADEYLSGDVKTKLDEAKVAAARDAKYQRNVDALTKIIPADKKPSEISVAIGASFVPPEIYDQFVRHISGAGAIATYVRATGQWLLNFTGQADSALSTGKYGTDYLSSPELFQLSMLGRGAVVRKTYRHPDGTTETVVLQKETEAAREKQNVIKAEWQSWLWRDPARAEQIASIYNEKMNRIVNRKFDGSHLSFPGMNPAIALLDHQKNGVWRGLQSYQVLYDHVVGAGKTFEMATLAMEMRRLGIARKPLFVVPNHLTMQWRSEFTRLYPGSNILAATPEDFSRENRERLFSKIVTGDWDAVVIGHSSLKKIGLPMATERAVLQEQVDELAAAIEEMKRERGDRNILRDMEKIKSNLESKMNDKLAALGDRSKVVSFDELGIDAMFVDEMHEFKNLFYHSTMDRSPGMGNPKGSDKSFDLFVKVRWLFDTFGEKTPFITATGTPVSNSLVEMFNMQRYMQYPTLKKEGLNVFDAWAHQFGNVENVYEVAPSGTGYRQSTRFAKFTNLPALMGLYNSFADTVTLDDLKAQEEAQGKTFPVPKMAGGRPQIVVAKRSPRVADFMGVPRAQTTDEGAIEFNVDLEKPIEIAQNEKTGKWLARVGDVTVGDSFETREDAALKLVEDAVTPVVDVDPESILGRFARLKELTKRTKGKVNALSLTGEANKAGLDYRLIDPSAPDFPGSKINLAVDNMVRLYRKWRADKGTQLVFCDLSIPLSARASYSSKARRLYVRNDAGAIDMKRGTMHTMEGQEEFPYFVLTRGEKDLRRFDVYDAASGAKILSDLRTKNDAIDEANALLSDVNKRQAWIDKRERAGEIAQEEIDDYNNANDVETEGIEWVTREDIAGASGAGRFSVYDDIRAKLVKKGIPEREIAFIHDFSTPTAKDKLFKAVNSGEIRFLLGSTPKMGAGTNVQKRLVALHHIDAPWRPSDLEQREGRIIRRGNELYARDPEQFEVFIGRYATEQTYDTRRWQILEHKARGIEQLRNYDGSLNEIDDIEGEAANAADMKAAASGDPLILEETRLRNEVRRLEQLQVAHADDVMAMTQKAKTLESYTKQFGPTILANLQERAATVKANPANKDGWSPPVVDGKKIDDKETAEERLGAIFDDVRTDTRPFAKVGYRGLSFEFKKVGGSVYAYDPDHNQMTYWMADQAFSASGFIQRMRNWVDRIPSRIENVKAEIKNSAEAAAGLREQAKVPFNQTTLLEKTREDHKTVHRALMAKGPTVPDEQKAAVAEAIVRQKKRLNALGFGKALREFYRTGAAQDEAQKIIGASAEKPLAALSPSLLDDIEATVYDGAMYAVPSDRVETQLQTLGDLAGLLPDRAIAGVLESVTPDTGSALDPLNWTMTATFRQPDGQTIDLRGIPLAWLTGTRAFALPPALAAKFTGGRPAIFLNNLGATGDLARATRGEVWHELLHVLWRNGNLDPSIRRELLLHARILGVARMSQRAFYGAMGDPDAPRLTQATLRDLYKKLYANSPDINDRLQQEEVAHMLELYAHGHYTADEMEPVQSILDDIASGVLAGKGAAAVERAAIQPADEPVLAALRHGDALSMREKIDNISAVNDLIASLPGEQRRALTDALDVVVTPVMNYVHYDVVRKGEPAWDKDGESLSVGSFKVRAAQRPDALGVEVANAYLFDDLQRQGIGSKVYDMVDRDFAALGGVSPSPDEQLSPAAQAFWRKRAAGQVGGRTGDVSAPPMDAVVQRISEALAASPRRMDAVTQEIADAVMAQPTDAVVKRIAEALAAGEADGRGSVLEVGLGAIDAALGAHAGTSSPEQSVTMASLTPVAQARAHQIEQSIKEAVEIITRTTGQGAVDVKFQPQIAADEALSPEQRRALGLSNLPATAGGTYRRPTLDAKAVITLATADPAYDIRTVAGHEAYHHVETVLASPQEMKLLRAPSEMQRATRHAAAEIGRSVEETAKLPDYEIRAIAYQRYRRMREEGMQVGPLHIGIRRFWDRLTRIFQNVRNALRGQGFDSMESIFERARTGEMAARAPGDGDVEPTPPRPGGRRTASEQIREIARRVANDDRASAMSSGVRAFADQWLTQSDGAALSLASVYEAYAEWSDEAGADALSLQTFTQVMSDLGYRRVHIAGRDRFVGIAVKERGNRTPASLAMTDPIADANAAEVAAEVEKGFSISEAFRRVGQRLMLMLGLAPDRAAETEARLAHIERMQAAVANDNSATAAIHGNVIALPSTMASFFPTASSPGTFFGRRVAAQMPRMAPLSDQWRVRLQDKFLMMRRQQEAIEGKTGSTLPLSLDVYAAESLYHGRAGERMADLQQKHVEPLVEFLRANEIDADQLGDYLYARHAEERNAYIRTIDPGNDAGSGMTDQDARDLLARVGASPKAQAYAEAARMVDTINKQTRDTLLSAGLISRETYDAWESDYEHYVPLRGFEATDDEPAFPRVGKGFNVSGPEAMRALGRRSKSDNPLAYVLLQAQQAIVRAEKNRVNKTLMRLVQAHPDPDVWQVYKGEYKRTLKTDPATGKEYVDTVFVPPAFSAHDPSIVGVKIGGKQHYIQIHNPNLARALRGIGSSEFDHAIVRGMMGMTRFYAQLLTSWNPEFVIGNFFRDVQTALLNSKGVSKLPPGARKTMLAEALSLKSIRGIYNAIRGDGTTEHARYFEEFRQAGGKISFMEMDDVERIKKRINGLLNEGNAKRALRQATKYVEDLNTSVENGVRLSTYIAMRKAGVSQDEAASAARELTVNFNRKGEWGSIVNAAYLFFNASVQGSMRIVQAMRHPAVRRAVVAIFGAGLALEIINHLVSGDDDDKENAYDKIKSWIKERNMIFMLPGRKDYIMIPMPYGYNVPFIAGQKIGEMARSVAGHGKLTPAKAAAGVMSALMDSFNPLGTSPRVSFMQMVSPTILDPVTQVAENKTWYGGPIYPTKFDKNKPDSENYFSSVHPAFIDVAKWINRGTRGNAARAGWADISPEVLEHYTQFVGGGIAKFVLNATGTGQRLLSGDEFIPEKTPILRRIYGAQTSSSRRADFYEQWTKVDAAYYEVRQLSKAGDAAGAASARQTYAAELAAYGAMKGTQKALAAMSKERARIQLNREIDDVQKKARLDAIKTRENAIILRALETYYRAQKTTPR